MPTYNVKVIYEAEIVAEDDCHAEEKDYELMEVIIPTVEVEEVRD